MMSSQLYNKILMKDKALLWIFGCSAVISAMHIAMSLVIVPHIFGLLISITMFIINVLYLVYIVKIKKKLKEDYKIQYEMMGRKKKSSCFSISFNLLLKASYLVFNGLMIAMVVIRTLSIAVNWNRVYLTDFPFMCDQTYTGNSCSRLVLFKNSCFRVEPIQDKYTLIYDSNSNSKYQIGFFVNYCS